MGIKNNTRGVVVPVRVYCCGYQRGCSTKVDCHGIAYQVCGYQQSSLMQFLAMTEFILRVLKIIPAGWWCLCVCIAMGISKVVQQR